MNQRLLQLLVIGCMAWFACWACAPMMSVPPPRPMAPDQIHELGSGAAAMNGTIFGNELAGLTGEPDRISWEGAHVYYRHRPRLVKRDDGKERILHTEWGAMLFFYPAPLGSPGYQRISWGPGFFGRLTLNHPGNVSTSLQMGAVASSVAVQAPLAFEVTDGFWLTSQPGLALNPALLLYASPIGLLAYEARLPIGLGVRMGELAYFDAEVGQVLGMRTGFYGGLNVAIAF